MTINSIKAGETFSFTTGLSGTDTAAFTTVLSVMQYPDQTPAITRTITNSTETLTSAETLNLFEQASPKSLAWTLYIQSSDSDEDVREPVKLYISKGWA